MSHLYVHCGVYNNRSSPSQLAAARSQVRRSTASQRSADRKSPSWCSLGVPVHTSPSDASILRYPPALQSQLPLLHIVWCAAGSTTSCERADGSPAPPPPPEVPPLLDWQLVVYPFTLKSSGECGTGCFTSKHPNPPSLFGT